MYVPENKHTFLYLGYITLGAARHVLLSVDLCHIFTTVFMHMH